MKEATRENYGPGVYSQHINLLYFSAFTFCSYKQKYQKYKLSSLSDLTFVSDRKGIDNPLSRWLRSSYLFVQVRGTRAWSPTGLIPWFSKTEGNTYATVLHHPTAPPTLVASPGTFWSPSGTS